MQNGCNTFAYNWVWNSPSFWEKYEQSEVFPKWMYGIAYLKAYECHSSPFLQNVSDYVSEYITSETSIADAVSFFLFFLFNFYS